MLVIVVDTSTPAVAAALVRVGSEAVEVIAERATEDARAHGELLAPQVEAVLRAGGAGPRDLTAVVAGLGPGPFTGLRVGLVTAVTMSQALGIPAYGVCSLDGIGARTTGDVVAATDARRKEIYWARYRDGVRVDGPAVGRPHDVIALLASGRPDAAAGAAAAQLELPVRGPEYPDLSALAELAADRIRGGEPSEAMTPLYLRRPDAVEPGARKLVRQ